MTAQQPLLERTFAGFRYTFDAIAFVRRHRRYVWFVFPTLILILMFLGGFQLSGYLSAEVTDFLKSLLDKWIDASAWPSWVYWVIWGLFRISIFLLITYIGGYVVLILMAPYLSWISVRTEILIGGTDTPFSWSGLMRETFLSIVITSRNFGVEILLTTALFALGFIPIFTPFVPLLIFFIAAWFYGFALLQPLFERRLYTLHQSRAVARQNFGLTMGLGMQFALLAGIPFIGIIFCAYFSVLLTIAATLGLNGKG
jgi:CysZ protein